MMPGWQVWWAWHWYWVVGPVVTVFVIWYIVLAIRDRRRP